MSEFFDVIEALQQGAVIAYPTEGVYGLGCDPLCESAVLRLLALKKRKVDKGLILIAASVEQIMPYIAPIPQNRMQEVLKTWPGPFTWIFPATQMVPKWICGDHKTIAVRVTAHPVVKTLCTAFGGPLVSTSANLQGQPPVYTAHAVKEIFPTGIAVIVPGKTSGLKNPTKIRDAISGLTIR